MPIAPRRRRLSALMCTAALLATACGGGSDTGDGANGGVSAPSPAPAPAPAPTPAPSPPSPTPPAPAAPPPPPAPAPAPAPGGTAMLGGCPSFPATAIFNTRIDDTGRFPAHGSSSAWIAAIGSTRALHADWGSNDNPAAADYYGIPINLLSATSPETDWP